MPQSDTIPKLTEIELCNLLAKAANSLGEADPVVTFGREALASSELALMRAASVALHVRLGEKPCNRCRNTSHMIRVPVTRSAEVADRAPLFVLRAAHELKLATIDRVMLDFVRDPWGRVSFMGFSCIDWFPHAGERMDEIIARV